MVIRSRKLYYLLSVIIGFNIILFLYLKPIPIIRNIVHETNMKINNIQPFKNINEESDQTYLEYLGFSDAAVHYSQNYQSVAVGSAVSSANFNEVFNFIQCVNSSLSQIYDTIILFDTGLRSWHINQLKKKCNKLNYCEIRNFEFEKFPYHISHLITKSYKPLAVQMLMKEFEKVIWIDLADTQFLPFKGFRKYWKTITKNDSRLPPIQGWSITWPTSSVTHLGMFEYFQLKSEQFYFHRMMSTKYFLITRSEFVRKKIMFPWIKCILSYECIEPLGSKLSGCDFLREPHFLYSGCHWYEMSAFNIVLGLAYKMNTSEYLSGFPSVLKIPGFKNLTLHNENYINYLF